MKRIAFFAEDEQFERLKALSMATRIKASEYIREGIDLVLIQHWGELKKIQKERGEIERQRARAGLTKPWG